MNSFWSSSWFWLFVMVVGFGLCAFLPVWIKDEKMRQKVNWFILIPVSLILILYAYPMGLEVFRRLALQFK